MRTTGDAMASASASGAAAPTRQSYMGGVCSAVLNPGETPATVTNDQGGGDSKGGTGPNVDAAVAAEGLSDENLANSAPIPQRSDVCGRPGCLRCYGIPFNPDSPEFQQLLRRCTVASPKRLLPALTCLQDGRMLTPAWEEQRPTLLYCPGLSARAWWECKADCYRRSAADVETQVVSELRDILEPHSAEILHELRDVLLRPDGEQALFGSSSMLEGVLATGNAARKGWQGVYLLNQGQVLASSYALFPRTWTYLQPLRKATAKVSGRKAPLRGLNRPRESCSPRHYSSTAKREEAEDVDVELIEECSLGFVFFSFLPPGSHIEPHTGASNVRLRAHLCLQDGCATEAACPSLSGSSAAQITVGNTTKAWRRGRVCVFDDSFTHHVDFPARQQEPDMEDSTRGSDWFQRCRVVLVLDPRDLPKATATERVPSTPSALQKGERGREGRIAKDCRPKISWWLACWLLPARESVHIGRLFPTATCMEMVVEV
eukprot:scaffold849_cov386-Prasinococcus_capsulatus_cf.AAC.13